MGLGAVRRIALRIFQFLDIICGYPQPEAVQCVVDLANGGEKFLDHTLLLVITHSKGQYLSIKLLMLRP